MLEAGKRVRPLPRRRRRRHPLPHLARHASDARRLLHPRHHARTAMRAIPRKARSTSTTCSACCSKFETAKRLVPQPDQREARAADARSARLFRLDRAGDDRGAGSSRRARHPSRHAAHPRLPVRRRHSRLRRRARPASSSSSRTATRSCARCWSMKAISTRRGSIPILHYDGTPITARFIVKAIADMLSSSPSPRSRRRCREPRVASVRSACWQGPHAPSRQAS